MSERCPHCGADLPPTGDAYCPECFRGVDEPTARQRAALQQLRGKEPAPGNLAGRVGFGVGAVWGLLGGLRQLANQPQFDVFYALGYLTGGSVILGAIGWAIGTALHWLLMARRR